MIQAKERQLLYVDDTEEQRYVMRRILEQAGFTVLEAGTGTEALNKLHPDILAVILDVKLPDMSGYEVCRRIKAGPATAAIPVLQISASFADPTLRAAGLSGGADAYVAQPVHPAELLSLVNALIRSHDSEKTLRFQADVSGQLAASLDYEEVFACVERVFVPRFADHCYIVFQRQAGSHAGPTDNLRNGTPDTPGLSDNLRKITLEVIASGLSRLIDRCTIAVPLEVGRKRLGALVFVLDPDHRNYTPANITLAEDLADRAALALQNATLYTAQQVAQQALIQSEKLAAAGRLSAAIAHEINNPLESITNLMYLIDTSDEITPTIKGYVQEALSELSRLTHIARQSLGFYRELTGPTVFDLNESVEDTINIYRKRFEAKHIEIGRKYHPGPLQLSAVKGEVRQVISNLLVNAYDALSANGHLTVSTDAQPASTAAPALVILSLTDNGSGIPSDVVSHIFEPFFTTKEGTGTGLGLWVSDTIVTKHGGSIEVISNTGGSNRGTTFKVSLPAEANIAEPSVN
jgi:two-component system NtrC family sensor kinase